MIQSILFAIIGIWLVWGAINVIVGVAQILFGLVCGILSVFLYTLAAIIETVGAIWSFLRRG